jgi:hypothetical protein
MRLCIPRTPGFYPESDVTDSAHTDGVRASSVMVYVVADQKRYPGLSSQR